MNLMLKFFLRFKCVINVLCFFIVYLKWGYILRWGWIGWGWIVGGVGRGINGEGYGWNGEIMGLNKVLNGLSKIFILLLIIK